MNVLHPLSVTNRKIFVYAAGANVYYMKLSESNGEIGEFKTEDRPMSYDDFNIASSAVKVVLF